jgi:anti-sigma B factor antagonist
MRDRRKESDMQAASTMKDNKSIIALSGRLDFSSRKALRSIIDENLARGCCEFVLDLHHVDFVDSSGLGALIACYSTVRKQGGGMTLVRLPRQVHDLMELTKLTTFFDICDTEEAALHCKTS